MNGKYGLKNNEILLGVILILIGISLLTEQLMWFNLVWQLLVVLWGALLLKEKNIIQGLIVLVFGVVFLLDTIFNTGLTTKIIGVSVIAFGIKVLFEDLRGK